MIRADQFGATIHVMVLNEMLDVYCASTGTVRGFEDGDGISSFAEFVAGGKPGESRTDDANGFGGRCEVHNFRDLREMFFGNDRLMLFDGDGFVAGGNGRTLV